MQECIRNDPDVYAAFIRGLIKADGTVHNGYVSWTMSTLQFSYDVQRVLLALGFVTTGKYEHPTRTSWAINTRYILRLLNVSIAQRFMSEIRFYFPPQEQFTG